MALFRRLTCRRCRATFWRPSSMGGWSRKGMWPSSMGGWSQGSGGRPLWAAGLKRNVAVLYGRLVSREWLPSSVGGWSRKECGRPLWAAGLEGVVAILYGRLVLKDGGRPLWAAGLVVRSSQGRVGGGSTPGHQGLL
jgi:hypothetical protein